MIDENLSCKEIKIFAMSKDEPRFKNKAYAYVQREFFLKDLVNEKGKFLYYRNGIYQEIRLFYLSLIGK